ncbi:hypothetical protein PFNF135_01829, partial [Plasmodium falciparum NF135/5.C10]
MAPTNRGGHGGKDEEDRIDDTSAKHLLDSIGKRVHAQVQNEAAGRGGSELKGLLSLATFSSEETGETNDPCIFNYTKVIKATDNNETCGKGKEDRFSKNRIAEYDKKKIRGNNGGASAPYRKLSLCNKNLETINIDIIDNKQKLLAEVCMAAKYEGNSIKTHYPKYQATYGDSPSELCTVLARSFADIGDIVRGKDLYIRNKKKDKLEENLQKIFAKIYHNLTDHKAKERYKDTDKNYYKLREDWWEANRETVWKAITCDADGSYFRKTCSDEQGESIANHKCRCPKTSGGKANDQVPTYFDYVPQFLRWFEEWAEDFCRKKKKYVDIVKTYCRKKDNSSDDRYCSRNGYDCEKTVNARGKVRMGKGCTDCFFACNPYIDWINNQKEQFDKQVKKYTKEITSGGGRAKRAARSSGSNSDNNGYEKIFYKKLKGEYRTVDAFLGLLNNEKACTAVKDSEGGKIDFKQVKSADVTVPGGGTSDTSGTNDKEKGTFYRSDYCQPCPLCGMKKTSEGKFEEKSGGRCTSGKLYEPTSGAIPTDNTILKSGEGKDDIEEKLDAFCKTEDDKSLYAAWKCYKHNEVKKVQGQGEEEDEDEEDVNDVKAAGGLCILQNTNKKNLKDPEEFQKTFYDFFYYWVAHMLKDSIHWRTKKLDKCLQNGTKIICKKGCHGKCDCYKRWIGIKEKEWENIKKHFNKQDDIVQETQTDAGVTLAALLELEFLKGESTDDSEEKSENSLNAEELKHLKHIKKLLDEDEQNTQEADAAPAGKKKTLMDKLIDHELNDAKDCLGTHKDDQCKPQEQESVARSDSRSRDTTPPASEEEPDNEDDAENADEDEDDDDDDDEESEDHQEDKDDGAEVETPKETAATTPGVKPPPAPAGPDVCKIVDGILTKDTLQEACKQKYGGNNSRLGWKCVTPSGKPSDTTGSSGEPTGGKDGATCIPPRRRRLY